MSPHRTCDGWHDILCIKLALPFLQRKYCALRPTLRSSSLWINCVGVVLFKLIRGFAGMCLCPSVKEGLFYMLFQSLLEDSHCTKESCYLCCNSSPLEMTVSMSATDLYLFLCVVFDPVFCGWGLWIFRSELLCNCGLLVCGYIASDTYNVIYV